MLAVPRLGIALLLLLALNGARAHVMVLEFCVMASGSLENGPRWTLFKLPRFLSQYVYELSKTFNLTLRALSGTRAMMEMLKPLEG